MFNSLKPMVAVMALALAAPAGAQDTSGAAGGTADEILDMGQSVAAETETAPSEGPKPGERYSREKHGDWDMACVKTNAETDPCSMLQMLNGPDGQPMAEVSLFRIAQDGGVAVAGATVIVPLETLLPAALTISIDGAPGKRYNYTFCNPVGCVAQIGLTQGDVDSMQKGNEATFAIRPAPAPDQLIELKMSLKGFTSAYKAVDVVQQ